MEVTRFNKTPIQVTRFTTAPVNVTEFNAAAVEVARSNKAVVCVCVFARWGLVPHGSRLRNSFNKVSVEVTGFISCTLLRNENILWGGLHDPAELRWCPIATRLVENVICLPERYSVEILTGDQFYDTK